MSETRSGGRAAGARAGSRAKAIALSLIPAVLFVGAAVWLLVASPTLRAEMVMAWDLLRQGDAEPLREWLARYGFWAPVVSGLLQIVTSVFPPGPSFLLGIANAMLYGAVWGGLLTFVTALAAAAICFGIARAVGRPGIERLLTSERLGRVDGFMERRGMLAVFIARLIPFINPDVVSYGAGVTKIGWIPFLVAVGAGAVPATVFYSVVGATAVETAGWVVAMVAIASIVPLAILALVGRRFLREEE